MPRKHRLTAEDRIAHWVARWAPVTSMQVAQRFGRSRRTTYRRLQVQRDNQLLTLTEPAGSLPGVLYPTTRLARQGCRQIHGAELANHLVAVQRVIAYERDGRALLAAHELDEHPGLLDRLPHHRDRPLKTQRVGHRRPGVRDLSRDERQRRGPPRAGTPGVRTAGLSRL
jgi:hypothetical protein